jgi:hypothetical protein
MACRTKNNRNNCAIIPSSYRLQIIQNTSMLIFMTWISKSLKKAEIIFLLSQSEYKV